MAQGKTNRPEEESGVQKEDNIVKKWFFLTP